MSLSPSHFTAHDLSFHDEPLPAVRKMSTLDLRVAHLLDGSGLTAAQREEQLVAAVALRRTGRAGGVGVGVGVGADHGVH